MNPTSADHDLGFVKAPGDLTGPASTTFQSELGAAIQNATGGIVIDLARPSAIDGRAVAALLMARNSADAAGKSLTVHMNHDWPEFEQITVLADVVTR
jgi:anti-anti-sigma regulatory factor